MLTNNSSFEINSPSFHSEESIDFSSQDQEKYSSPHEQISREDLPSSNNTPSNFHRFYNNDNNDCNSTSLHPGEFSIASRSPNTRQFSNSKKRTLKPKKTKKIKRENIEYTFYDYMENTTNLNNFYLCDLKRIAKKLKLNITAKKQVVIKRIKEHFNKVKSAILIQKIFRGFLVKLSFKLRGPAFKNRNICVNDNDAYTLEPIHEIPFERFYSFCDKKNFVYGFDIIYLLICYKKNNRIMNPFSRELISSYEINDLLRLEKKIKILYPYIYQKDEIDELDKYDLFLSLSTEPSSHPTIDNRFSLASRSDNPLNSHIRFEDDSAPTNIILDNSDSPSNVRRFSNFPTLNREIWSSPALRTGESIDLLSENNTTNGSPHTINVIDPLSNMTYRYQYYTEIWNSPSFHSGEILIDSRSSNVGRFSNTERIEREPVNELINLGSSSAQENIFSPTNRTNEMNVQTKTMNMKTQSTILLTKKMEELRRYPLNKRIDNLFIEIDTLGNYTSSSWFNDIDDYSVFFANLYTIWNYRLILNINEKRKISQLHDPFMNHTIYNTRNMTNTEIKELCVSIIENFVHGGVDEEYRKLGIYRVIMALTMVNYNARTTYNWLYESIL
jgi:hypothetical protein